jgi:F0F1-type ATP synthase membrane subunit a
MIIYGINQRASADGPGAVRRAVRQPLPAVAFNFMFSQWISKPLSHSLRLFGNICAGRDHLPAAGMWA